jgi:hypothetical protein
LAEKKLEEVTHEDGKTAKTVKTQISADSFA